MGTDTWECVLATWMTVAGILAGYGAIALMLMGLGYLAERRTGDGVWWWERGLVLGVVGGVLMLGAKWASGFC